MRILHITPADGPQDSSAPSALELLPHVVHRVSGEQSSLLAAPECDIAVLDATAELRAASVMVQRLRDLGLGLPLIIVLTEGGLAAVSAAWEAADFVLPQAGPAELDARLRMAYAATETQEQTSPTTVGPLIIDEEGFTAAVDGQPLDLTYREFELLRHLVGNPGRAFTREQLLHDVWGYDYYGGTRTVDVHIRRLRAKLGPELDSAIHTVRNVGYRFSPQSLEEDDR